MNKLEWLSKQKMKVQQPYSGSKTFIPYTNKLGDTYYVPVDDVLNFIIEINEIEYLFYLCERQGILFYSEEIFHVANTWHKSLDCHFCGENIHEAGDYSVCSYLSRHIDEFVHLFTTKSDYRVRAIMELGKSILKPIEAFKKLGLTYDEGNGNWLNIRK